MSKVDDFLDMVEGSKLPYVEVTEDAKNPYCDSCSEAIHPNTDVQLYGVDKLIGDRPVPGGFRMVRLHCSDCTLPETPLPCEGYDEYLIDATLDRGWRIREPGVRDVSPARSGTPWNPKAVFEDLFGIPYSRLVSLTGQGSQGPLDVVDTLLLGGTDPREVIHEDGSHTITDEHRGALAEQAESILSDRAAGDGPPQPSMEERMKAYLGDWEGEDDA